MIKLLVEKDDLLEIIVNRLKNFWKVKEEDLELYREMYKNNIDDTFYDDEEIDLVELVDNDFINNYKIIDQDDNCFKTIKKIYEEFGACYIDDETDYNFLEASNKDNSKFLVRHK